MNEPYNITTEDYIRILENVKDHVENRVYARFNYIDKNTTHEGWVIDINHTHIISTIGNLKVRFEDKDDAIEVYLSMSRQGSTDDKDLLLSTANSCMLDENKPRLDMDTWIVLYEWYTRQCLAIKVDDIVARKASCVITTKEMWLIDQELSVSERAMQNVWDKMNIRP